MWMKSKFVNHVIITYSMKKRDKKIHGFEMLIFWKCTVILSISRNYLQIPSLDNILLEILHCQIQLF